MEAIHLGRLVAGSQDDLGDRTQTHTYEIPIPIAQKTQSVSIRAQNKLLATKPATVVRTSALRTYQLSIDRLFADRSAQPYFTTIPNSAVPHALRKLAQLTRSTGSPNNSRSYLCEQARAREIQSSFFCRSLSMVVSRLSSRITQTANGTDSREAGCGTRARKFALHPGTGHSHFGLGTAIRCSTRG